MIRKQYLNKNELEKVFDVIKRNMINLGFQVTKNDKDIWCENIKKYLKSPNFYFYLVYHNNEIVGFVEIISNNNDFTICEIQLAEKVQHTKIILKIIKYLLTCHELSNVNEVTFSILKNNKMSNKTFSHLGAKIVSESEKKFKYKISRNSVNSFISKLI